MTARTAIAPPKGDPCPSCPYRRDHTPGTYRPPAYDRLAAYDAPRYDQPPEVMTCTEQPVPRVCGGWAAVHDGYSLLALGAAGIYSGMTEGAVEATLAYTTGAALFASGAEAAAHGLNTPPPEGQA